MQRSLNRGSARHGPSVGGLLAGGGPSFLNDRLASWVFPDRKMLQSRTNREGREAMNRSSTKISVVLVHGAWADGSSWARVITPLQSRGLDVVAAPIPLTSLSDDVDALERVLQRTENPVVLIAHAYAGAVTSAITDNRVQSLVFIAALTPNEGETVGEVFYREEPHPDAPRLTPDGDGFVWLPNEAFGMAFCQHASWEQAALLGATQRPIALACIQEKARRPAWKTVPSWYLVAEEDRMISPATQQFLARRMGARIRSERTDHLPLVTAPELVVDMIVHAVIHSHSAPE
jgi:pimeloyl-ACP methyl ester carboxylesterase